MPEVPKTGYGKFEYVDQTLFIGEWRLTDDGKKVKHGKGKIIFPGTDNSLGQHIGSEEYDGDWVDDHMHGHGTYKFTSGNEYIGNWEKGVMQGVGKMVYNDGSSYEGQWKNNLKHGEGIYVDSDKIVWSGIFVNGCFESQIQKKLQAEKIIQDKIVGFEQKAMQFFTQFTETFASSDKKTFKDNLNVFFGTHDTCMDFINTDPYPKFEDRPADKWNELIKGVNDDPDRVVKALSQKDESTLIPHENILID